MRRIVCLSVLLVTALPLIAQEFRQNGEGAIVTKDGTPVYKKRSTESEIEFRLKRGDPVAALVGTRGYPVGFYFGGPEGLGKVIYMRPGKSIPQTGFVEMSALGIFYYDAACTAQPGPFVNMGGFGPSTWSPCFRKAGGVKLDELQTQWAAESKSADPNLPAP